MAHIANIPCTVAQDHPVLKSFNSITALVYVSEYNIDSSSFEDGPKQQYNIHRISPAYWIKARNIKSQPFLLTFAQSKAPDGIYRVRQIYGNMISF